MSSPTYLEQTFKQYGVNADPAFLAWLTQNGHDEEIGSLIAQRPSGWNPTSYLQNWYTQYQQAQPQTIDPGAKGIDVDQDPVNYDPGGRGVDVDRNTTNYDPGGRGIDVDKPRIPTEIPEVPVDPVKPTWPVVSDPWWVFFPEDPNKQTTVNPVNPIGPPPTPVPYTPGTPPTYTPAPYQQAPAYQAPTFATPPRFEYAPFAPPPRWTPPSLNEALNDPGYQFRVRQGEDSLQRWAAAKGTLNDSSTARALEDYGQQAASQEYGNVWNRSQNAYQQDYANTLQNYLTGYGSAADQYMKNYVVSADVFDKNYGAGLTGYRENYRTQFADPNAIAGQNAADVYRSLLGAYNQNVDIGRENNRTYNDAGIRNYGLLYGQYQDYLTRLLEQQRLGYGAVNSGV